MIDDELRARLLSPMIREIRENFSALADINNISFKNEQTLAVEKINLSEINVFQDTLGEVSGRACISSSKKVAIEVGNKVISKILGTPIKYDDFNEDLKEAMQELLNVILGKSTELLERDNLGIIFNPPVLSLKHDQVLEGISEAIMVQIDAPSVGGVDFLYLIK